MITIPQTIVKGVSSLMLLDRTEVFALISDSYYSQVYNCKSIILNYVTEGRLQKETVVFNNTGGDILEGYFLVSEQVRGSMLIDSVTVQDFDNGRLSLRRDELVNYIEELDVIF